MSKKLEIGTPVFILPCSSDRANDRPGSNVLSGASTGVIADGPFSPGVYPTDTGTIIRLVEQFWYVEIDGYGPGCIIESLLIPVDGLEEDEPTAHEDQVSA